MQSNRAARKNCSSIKSHARLWAALAVGVVGGSGASRAAADTWTWTGAGGNAFWTTAGNWNHTGSGSSPTPTNSTDTIVNFAGSTNTSPNQNIGAPLGMNGIGFNSGAAAFTLTDDAVEFFATALNVNPTIVQNSSNTQQVQFGIIIETPLFITGSGIGTVDLEGNIAGNGSISTAGPAPVGLLASNSYTGGTTINNGGEVVINNNSSLGSGTLTFNGGTLTSTASVLMDNNLAAGPNAITFLAVGGTTMTVNPAQALFGSMNFGAPGAAGTINFEPANFSWFGGTINVNGGTLLDNADTLSQTLSAYTVAIASGATFNINGFSTTINNLTGAGTLATGTNSSESVTLNAASFSGIISGSGKLITPTSGSYLLTGSSTFTGGATVGGGTLGVSSKGLSTGAVVVTGNTTIYAGGGAAATLANPISINTGKSLTVVDDPNGNHRLTFNGSVSGSGALVMSGTGVLSLFGSNNYSGGTTLNSGQIIISGNNSFGQAPLTLNGGTISAASNASINVNSNDNTATAPITFLAPAGVTLTLGGHVSIGSDALNFGNSANTGVVSFSPGSSSFGGPVLNVNGGTLLNGDGVLSQILSGFNVTLASIGILDLNSSSTTIGGLNGSGTLLTGANSSETFKLDAANFSGNITGSGGLVTTSGGTIILSGSNSFSGGSNFAGGTVGAGNDFALSGGAITVSAGTNLYAAGADHTLANPVSINSSQALTIIDDPNGAHNLTLSGNIGGSGAVVMSGTGALSLFGTNSFTGGMTLSSGQINVNNSKSLAGGTVSLGTGTLVGVNSFTLNDNTFIEGPGTTAIQAAPGTTLVLAGTLHFGGTGLNPTLAIGSATNTGTVSLDSSSVNFGINSINVIGGTLKDDDSALADVLVDSKTLTIAQIATVNLNGFTDHLKNLVGSGTLLTGTNASQIVTLDAANFAGPITGSAQLATESATTSVILTASNSFAGGTTLAGGTVGAGNDFALASGAITVTAGTSLYAAAADHTLANPISISSGQSLTVVDDPNGAHNLTLPTSVGGAGSLVMDGSGALSLSASNSYSGGTTLNSGQIIINNDNAFGGGLLTINGGTITASSNAAINGTYTDLGATGPITFQAVPGATLTLGGVIEGLGSQTMIFGSAANTGNVNFSPGELDSFTNSTIDINGGTLFDGSGILTQFLFAYTVAIAPGATLDLNSDSTEISNLTGGGTLATGTDPTETLTLDAANFAGTITGSGQLTTTPNSGMVILTGTSTYTGGTNLGGGTIGFGSHLALANGPISVSGATSIYAQGSTLRNLSNPISIDAGQTLSVVDDPADSNRQTFQFASNISGSGGLVMSGSGTAELFGNNTYTGGTTINNGLLVFENADSLPAGGAIVNNFAVQFESAPETYVVGNLSGTGGLNVFGHVKLEADSGASTEGSIVFGTAGLLDLTNNRLVLNYAASGDSDPISQVTAALVTGYNSGRWTGLSGIASSTAALNPQKFAVGYLDGDNAADLQGNHVAPGQIILAYTLSGDAFLENSIGFDDLIAVAQNFGATGRDWAQGNFTYDAQGSVGFSDLIEVAQNFGQTSGVNQETGQRLISPMWQFGATSVPEPASAGLIVGALALLRRGRRRSNR